MSWRRYPTAPYETRNSTVSIDITSTTDAAARAANIATIRKYVDARTPSERARRWELYTEDCTSGAVAGEPLQGKEIARLCTEWNLVYFPGYVFNENIIFQSTDPDYFVVMSKGAGGISFPAYGEPKTYENVFFHVIRMRDGLMKDYFEYSNALGLYEVLGLEVPALVSPAGRPQPTADEMAHDPYPVPRYADPAHPDAIDSRDDELRGRNIATIEEFVGASSQEERARRVELFVDDDTCTIGEDHLGVLFGNEKAWQLIGWTLRRFPDYAFHSNVVFQTQDPNLFLVMSDGAGKVDFPAYGDPRPYRNVYFHTFRMDDGRIRDYYEYSNVKVLYDVLGVELEHIELPTGWPGIV